MFWPVWPLWYIMNQNTVSGRLIATLRLPYLPPALISSAGICSVPDDLYLFNFSVHARSSS